MSIRQLFYGLVPLMLLSACVEPAPLMTREQAKQLILNDIVKPASRDSAVMVFLTSRPLGPGDQVAPMGFPEQTVTLTDSAWFAWIDDEPDTEFEHDTRFVFIRPNRRVQVDNRQFYPVVNDTRVLWNEPDKWLPDDLLIYADPPITFQDTLTPRTP